MNLTTGKKKKKAYRSYTGPEFDQDRVEVQEPRDDHTVNVCLEQI